LPRYIHGDTTMPQKEISLLYNREHNIGNSLSYTDLLQILRIPSEDLVENKNQCKFRTKLKLYANKSCITWKRNEIYFNRIENSAEFNATKAMTTSKNSPSNSQKLRYFIPENKKTNSVPNKANDNAIHWHREKPKTKKKNLISNHNNNENLKQNAPTHIHLNWR
jgi:hypothetical protein